MGAQYKRFGTISIWVVLIAFVARCAISWHGLCASINTNEFGELVYNIFSYSGEAIGIASMIMFCFNNWLWKRKCINTWIAKMPVLKKNYSGTFLSSYTNEEYDARLKVNQTFLAIRVTFKTSESYSNSVLASIEEIHGVKRLVYTYINEPRGELRDRSPLHYGTASLRIDGDVLEGDYYTDRKTVGSIKMRVEE